MQHLNIKGFVMGVYRDRQGNYVTTENPTESHRNITDAYISEDTHKLFGLSLKLHLHYSPFQ